ncbi:hypothetical protein LINPERPRIM_LOCUS40987 [Linum perenne]
MKLTTATIGILFMVAATLQLAAVVSAADYYKPETVWCNNTLSRCSGAYVDCPSECPSTTYPNAKSKVCHVNCDHPLCKAQCKKVQFRFFDLSAQVDGVLGRTYQPDFENSAAKPGVAMPVMGGEDKYKTTDLLSTECGSCIFSSKSTKEQSSKQGNAIDFPTLDCTRGSAAGYGIVCRK